MFSFTRRPKGDYASVPEADIAGVDFCDTYNIAFEKPVHPKRSPSCVETLARVTLIISLLFNFWLVFTYLSITRELSPVPHLPSTQVTFTATEQYTGPRTSASTNAWKSLRLDPSGYVLLNDRVREVYHLQPGIPHESGSQIFGTSMYHQLHCLTMIRETYWNLMDAVQDPLSPGNKKFPRSSHIDHCFDYLRQSVQCAADLTLEPADMSEPGHSKINGWGVEHKTCKDWSVAEQWLRDNGVPERTGNISLRFS